MPQNWYQDVFQYSTKSGKVTMDQIELMLETLKSLFSGSGAPANPVAGMPWMKTGTGAGLRLRNSANNAWHKVLTGTVNQRIWVDRNNTDEGWKIDANVTDRVLALKGGTGAYNVNGGVSAGESWNNIKNHTHGGGTLTHIHQVYAYKGNLNPDKAYNSSGAEMNVPAQTKTKGLGDAFRYIKAGVTGSGTSWPDMLGDIYTKTPQSNSGATGGSSLADARPAARVGTLQYPDLA